MSVLAILCGSAVLVAPALRGVGSSKLGAGDLAPRARTAAAPPSYRTGIPVSGAVHNRIATVALKPAPGSYLETTPAWLTYDGRDAAFYVAVPASSLDIITNVTSYDYTIQVTVPVGSDPFGVAYDNLSGEIFVTNTGSDNVSVLSGFLPEPVASIPVGASPTGVSYDPIDNEVYVANSASNTVTIINATSLRVVSTVGVGVGPVGVAADPSGGNVYVADNGSNAVTVIQGIADRVLATVPVGDGPDALAVDNVSDAVYVSNERSANVSVLSEINDTVIGAISVGAGIQPQGIVYDWEDGLVWVAGGRDSVVVLDPATARVVSDIFYDPSGMVLDPVTGSVCLTNSANSTFACVLAATGTIEEEYVPWLTTSVPLNFEETGLGKNVTWELELAPYGPTLTAWDGSLSLEAYPGLSYAFSVVPDPPYWASPSSGVVAVGQTGATIDVRFSDTATYPVNFSESDLPHGTAWYVNISGQATLTSTSPTANLSLGNGTYNFTFATNNKDYQPAPENGSFVVEGARVYRSIAFSPAPLYSLSFAERGLPSDTDWEVALDGTLRSSEGSTIAFDGPNQTYAFQLGPVASYSPYPTTGSFVVDGAGVKIVVSFEPVGPVGGTKNVTSPPGPYQLFGLPGNEGWAVFGGLVGVAIAGALSVGYVLGRRSSGVGGPPSVPPGAGSP
jgi:YVTN family beta-propeller protein